MIKICTILILSILIWKGLKSRDGYYILFPILTLLLGYQHYQIVDPHNFIIALIINLYIVLFVILIIYRYKLWRIKKNCFKEAIDLDNIFFIIALSTAYPTITFILVCIFSTLFSILLSTIIKHIQKRKTVPFSGYIAIFLNVFFIGNWMIESVNFYLI